MNELGFEILSYQYPTLYKDVSFVEWDEFENILRLTFEDSNSNYKTLVDIFNSKSKQSIIIKVFNQSSTKIRQYDLELLPNTLRPSKLHRGIISNPTPYLLTSFKILKSELSFNE